MGGHPSGALRPVKYVPACMQHLDKWTRVLRSNSLESARALPDFLARSIVECFFLSKVLLLWQALWATVIWHREQFWGLTGQTETRYMV